MGAGDEVKKISRRGNVCDERCEKVPEGKKECGRVHEKAGDWRE